jgi:hypothetical protein
MTEPSPQQNRPLKVALAFGVIAATIEMGVILWFMYC